MTHTRNSVEEGAARLHLQQLDLRDPIEPRPQGCAVPLTAEQRYFLKDLICTDPAQQPLLSVRMCASATRISGSLNLGLLQGSIAGLVQRHESLRTTFRTLDGVTTQQIDPPGEYRLTRVDLSALEKSEAENEAMRAAREFQKQWIDLSIGPAFEARLFKLAPQEHVLIALADHMISDGISNLLLDKEIWQAYDEAIGDEPASLPTPPVQFADYAVWRERTKESWRREHDGYWKQRRPEGTPTIVPISADPNEPPDKGSVAHIPFGSELTAQLRHFAEGQGVAFADVMLMIYATAMSFWCEREDLVIRYPVHGRHARPELAKVIGFFSSYLCLRIKVDRGNTLQSLLAQVQEETRSALDHRDFDRMREQMPECVKTELEFHWRSARWRARSTQRRSGAVQPIRRQPFLIRSPISNGTFWCVFNETAADVCATVHYRVHLLQAGAIERFGNHLRSIARTLVDRPVDLVARAIPKRGREMYDALS